MTVREPDGGSRQASNAANEQRSREATGMDRKLAATALLRLGENCPPELEDVGTEVILHSEYSWSQIATRLGVSRSQAVHRFRRLLTTAGVAESSQFSQ
jgi:AraC-like DNA-binding protein